MRINVSRPEEGYLLVKTAELISRESTSLVSTSDMDFVNIPIFVYFVNTFAFNS